MTTLREAAQQALERLRKYHYGNGFAEDAECIADLEAALAQQAEPVEPVEPVATLIAQRDALLEAYRKMKNVAAGYSNLCDGSAFTRKLEREFEAADAIARAAIKAVEEGG